MNRGARPPGTHTTSFWTPATDARLRELWAAGVTSIAIAERLGCSKNSIIGRAHRLMLTPRANPVKGGAETRARNKAARADLVSGLVEMFRAKAAARIPPAARCDRLSSAPQMPVEAPAAPALPKPPQRLWLPSPHACLWPIGHPKQAGFRFCDAPAVADRPYCRIHCEIAYIGFGRPRPEPIRSWVPGRPQ
jgi:GcrA cell cycle regulator